MSDERQRIEPSMDEILASIRRIIAEDTARPGGVPPSPDEAEPTLAGATPTAESESSDVLLLTDMLDEDGSVVSLSEPVEPTLTARSVDKAEPTLTARSVDPGEPTPRATESRQEPSFSRPAAEPGSPRTEDPAMAVARTASQQLMSQDRAQASAALLRELVRSVTRANELSLGGDPTLHALVREALGPLLRDWLDANLPALVERLVRAEIDRVSARAEEEARG
jgi:cell pole-organizing protein PopZ